MNTFHVRKTGDVILLHLGKGDDMLQCLNQAITEHKIKNGAVVSMIGTLDKARYHMIQTPEDDPTNGRGLYLAEIAIEKYSEEELTRKKDNFGIAALSWKERDKTE